jgi:site-specific DNA-methyltransferase (adenine-specific)
MLPPLATIIEAAGWRWNNTLVWDKGYAGLGAGFRAQHELIIVASNGAPEWHSYDFGNVLKATRLTRTDHPHQKPIELFEPLFRTCAPKGTLVLDPFMGSGTTGTACVNTERNFIGIEIDPGYFAIAKKRITEAQLQMRLPMDREEKSDG